MPLQEAARLMHERKVGALPIVARGRLVDAWQTRLRRTDH
jgi:CBS domain-containing protein